MNEKRIRLIVILFIVILLAVMADIALRLLHPAKQQSRCLVVPTSFIMEHPDCADKLVQAANLTNVRIVSPKTLESQRYDQSVEANKTNGSVEVNHVAHPKVCIKQWRQEIITIEGALHCIDEYMERKDT